MQGNNVSQKEDYESVAKTALANAGLLICIIGQDLEFWLLAARHVLRKRKTPPGLCPAALVSVVIGRHSFLCRQPF